MRRVMLLAAMGAVALLGSAGSASAGTLDQEQPDGSAAFIAGCSLSTCYTQAQTFTAGRSGALDRVDLNLDRSQNTTEPFLVEIRALGADGCPSANTTDVLATGQAAATAVNISPPGPRGWVPITFGNPANVAAGTQYAILFYTSGYGVGGTLTDSYAAGKHCVSIAPVSPSFSWQNSASDLAFKTYVLSPPPTVDPDLPPETTITKHPPNRLDRSKAKFKFVSDESGATFECKIDRKPFTRCTSPKVVKRLDDGKHKFKVRAIDAAGNVDPTPAKDRFRVLN